tara:strand:+ start:11593 stop:12264 length:672 start_codon:yes stop_codon:yes gene_type:complete
MHEVKMKIIIPARGGSKRIPNKNIIDLDGKPLISYVIETSLQVTNDVYISTDSLEIEKVAKKYDVGIIKRPPKLATDFSTTNSVIKHFLDTIDNVGYFACVQPTSPLLPPFYLKKGFDKIKESGYNSIISVNKSTNFFWNNEQEPINFERNKKPRTQDIKSWYAENGAFYITSREDFLATNNLVNGKVGFIIMPKIMSFEIDDHEDLNIIQSVLRQKNERGVN